MIISELIVGPAEDIMSNAVMQRGEEENVKFLEHGSHNARSFVGILPYIFLVLHPYLNPTNKCTCKVSLTCKVSCAAHTHLPFGLHCRRYSKEVRSAMPVATGKTTQLLVFVHPELFSTSRTSPSVILHISAEPAAWENLG